MTETVINDDDDDDKDVDVERVIDCFSGLTTRRIALCFEDHNEENQSSDEDER